MSNDGGSSVSDGFSLPRTARFWILVVSNVVSIFCTIVVLVYMIINKKARTSLKNHVLFIALLFGLGPLLIDIPFNLNFLLHSAVIPANPTTCLLWIFVSMGFYSGQLMLLAWTAFERHILVFHDQWLRTRKQQICLHYFPLSILVLYILIFYIYLIYFYPCEHYYDYTFLYCAANVCYVYAPILTWHLCGNNIAPTFLEIFFTVSFLVRVIWQKIRVHQPIQWRKQRKMAIQLMSITSLNLFFYFPYYAVAMAYLCGMPIYVAEDFTYYLNFLTRYVTFLFPVVCLGSVVDIKKIFQERRAHRRIHVTGTLHTNAQL